jgi:hypothetical protein
MSLNYKGRYEKVVVKINRFKLKLTKFLVKLPNIKLHEIPFSSSRVLHAYRQTDGEILTGAPQVANA